MATAAQLGMTQAQFDSLVGKARESRADYAATGTFNNSTPQANLAAAAKAQTATPVSKPPSAYDWSNNNTNELPKKSVTPMGIPAPSMPREVQQQVPMMNAPMTAQPVSAQSNPNHSFSNADLINSMYQNNVASQQQAFEKQRQIQQQGLNGQETTTNQNALQNLNNNDSMASHNLKQLQEVMANNGVKGGDSITATIGNQTAQQNGANSINQDKANALRSIMEQRSLIDNNAAGDNTALIQRLQAIRDGQMLDDSYKQQDYGLNLAQLTGRINGQNTMQQNQNYFNNGIAQAGVTGQYGGQNTMAQNGQNFNNGISAGQLTGYYNQQGMNQQPNTQMIQQLMAANSAAYKNASPEQQAQLHQQNLGYANQLGMSYNPSKGTYANGNSGINGANPGNVSQLGMGIAPQGFRTLGGQQLDLQSQKQTYDQSATNPTNIGLGLNNKESQYKLDQLKDPNSITNQQLKAQVELTKSQSEYYKDHGQYYAGGGRASGGSSGSAASKTATANTFTGSIYDQLSQLSPNDYQGYLEANQGEIVRNIGQKAYDDFKKSVLADQNAQGKADTAQGKTDATIRSQAIAAAQKDPRWMDGKTDKNALISEYEGYHR